jgi:hypothetical protein
VRAASATRRSNPPPHSRGSTGATASGTATTTSREPPAGTFRFHANAAEAKPSESEAEPGRRQLSFREPRRDLAAVERGCAEPVGGSSAHDRTVPVDPQDVSLAGERPNRRETAGNVQELRGRIDLDRPHREEQSSGDGRRARVAHRGIAPERSMPSGARRPRR